MSPQSESHGEPRVGECDRSMWLSLRSQGLNENEVADVALLREPGFEAENERLSPQSESHGEPRVGECERSKWLSQRSQGLNENEHVHSACTFEGLGEYWVDFFRGPTFV